MPEYAPSLTALKTRPPALPAGLVDRPALSERLSAAVQQSVTVVSSGPGTGKTLTLASWSTTRATSPVAWLSLDESDNDLRTFWSDLIHALIASGGVPGDSPLRDISPAAEFGVTEVAEVRSRLAGLTSAIVIVLDDFHEIADQEVLGSFSGLVEHLPPVLRLVVLSRTDPPLRLHRLRVAGRLTEIRATDLAFSQPETARLFKTSGIDLGPDQVVTLVERTEGWAAGLRLAALSLDRDDPDAGIRRLSGTEHPIAEYLAGEVLARLQPSDRDFLLRTSIVDRLSGPLAGRLTDRPDAQAMLERLVRSNAFVVELGGSSEWFSYHRMMREMLLHRLGLEQPDVKTDLHAVAARWMVEHGQLVEAIRQFILAGDYPAAGRTLLSAIPRIVSPDGPALAAAVEPLALRIDESPSLSSLLAAATWHFHRQQYNAMRQDSAEARHFLHEASEEVTTSAEVVLLLFEMVAARTQGDPGSVVELASHAIHVLDAGRSRIPAARGLRTIAESNRAGAQIWTGGSGIPERLKSTADQALELGLPLPHLNAISHLALLDALHGRCRAAHRRSGEALALIERHGWGSEPQALAAFLARALVELTRGRTAVAGALVRRGLAASGKETDRSVRIALAIAAVIVAVRNGDENAALAADARVLAGLASTPAQHRR